MYKKRIKHLISDVRHCLPGMLLCSVFLSAMTAAAGKVCPTRLLLGIPCPGCGLTRAAVLLLKGEAGWQAVFGNPVLGVLQNYGYW